MYRKAQEQETPPENFELPFGGQLASDNRWVIMAKMIPWSEFEAEYAAMFSEEIGAPAKTFRIALGALIIKEKLGIREARNSRANKGESLSAILYRNVSL